MHQKDYEKTQAIINDIVSGNFSFLHIELLLIKIREYVNRNTNLRELGDFVAHAKERNKGLTFSHTNGFFLHLKFLQEYTFNQKQFDISMFPLYVKDLLTVASKNVDKKDLKKEKLTMEMIRYELSRIEENRLIGSAFVRVPTTTCLRVFNLLLSRLVVRSLFKQKDVISNLFDAIRRLKFEIDQNAFFAQYDSMTFCILGLLDRTEINFTATDKGELRLRTTKDENDDWGKIELMANVPLNAAKGSSASFAIFETKLKATEYLNENMFGEIPNMVEGTGNHFGIKWDYPYEFCYNTFMIRAKT